MPVDCPSPFNENLLEMPLDILPTLTHLEQKVASRCHRKLPCFKSCCFLDDVID